MRIRRTLLAVTAVGILSLVTSCRDIVAPTPVATISLSGYAADLVPSETVLITATPKEAGGTALTRTLLWSSSAPAVATVENGLITGHALGVAVVTVESEGVRAQVAVTVDDGGIITPGGNHIYALGGQVELAIPSAAVTQSARIVISSPQLAAASTRLIPGSAVSIRTPTPLTQPAMLTIKYDPTRILGSPESGLVIYQATSTDWQPVAGSSVDPTSKTVRARITTTGVYGIFAQARVGSVAVSPATPSFEVGETGAFSTLLKDEDGVQLAGRAVAWSSSAPEILEIDATSGAAQAKSPGQATVTATVEGKLGSTLVSVTTGSPTKILVVAGDGQSADTSSAVAIAPSVKVTDDFGFAVSGVSVTFAVTAGGGTISPASAATDAAGIATADRWTLGRIAGANSIAASLPGGASVAFSATATQPPPPAPPAAPPAPPSAPPSPAAPPAPALVPTTIMIIAGDGQSALPLTAVAINPAVKVTTATGVPVPDITVTFSIRSGGGSVTGASAKTDSMGIATAGKWTLGSGGGNSLFATATGLSGSPLIFIATATTLTSSPPPAPTPPASPAPTPPPGTPAGPPVAMAIYAGDAQNAAAGSPTIVAPAVKVTDAAGVGVPDVVVTFSVRSGGGSVSGENATTNSQGIATLGQWRLGSVGGQSLFATRAGLTGSPLVFTAMATGAVRIVTFGDSNTDAGWAGTNQALVATSYISVEGPRAGPNAHNPTQLAGKIEAKWRAASSVSFAAVNHGISGTGTGSGRTGAGAPNAREIVDGVTRFAGEVLGAGYPWSGGESGSNFPNGPVRRVGAFVPGPNDFVYVSMGTNDSNGGWDAQQSAANLNWMIDQWVATGHQPDHFILTTLAPRPNTGAAIVLLNIQIRQIISTRGVRLVDIAQRTSDDNGVTWRSKEDHIGDEIHFSEAVRDWVAQQVVAYLLTKAPR
ncbi:MAG TPA: SGNH/GDSL hydrolase family protein [Gemmatimonadaceae bacterium]|nr:SGNH/GDSL hydrolase family protein [Gemmatimonadaceae bacterium]